MWLDTDILECDLKGDLINVQRIINQTRNILKAKILKWKSEIKINKISEIELSMIESKGNV